MGTALTEPEVADQPEQAHDPSVADVELLEDKFPEWFRLRPSAAGFAFLIGVTLVLYGMIVPLNHTDLWGHLTYGRLLTQTRALPATEPLMPLSTGVRFVDTAWLSQVIGYGAYQLAGKAMMSFLYGLSIAVAVGFILKRIYNRTGSALIALAAYGLFIWVEFQQLLVIRPQLAGFALFCILLATLTRRRLPGVAWVGIPVMFALWANLHGSFVVGLGLLACFTAGRAADVLRRTGQLRALFRDDGLRRTLLLTELAAAATLLNPYGLAIYSEILSISNNPNLQTLIEWYPLNLRMLQGQAAAVVVLLLFIVYRISPRRVSAAELFSLAVFGAATLWSSRMLMWWGPIAVLFLAIHAGAAWRRRSRSEESEPAPGASLWTVVSIMILFISFEMTHLGGVVLDAALQKDPQKRQDKVAVTDMTPVGATKYLRDNPPDGIVFNSYEFGDYLLWAGPANMKVFAASHAHLIPQDVWDDYLGVVNQRSGWNSILSRHGINTVVLDEKRRSSLIRRLFESEDWNLVFRDDRSAILKRKKPI